MFVVVDTVLCELDNCEIDSALFREIPLDNEDGIPPLEEIIPEVD